MRANAVLLLTVACLLSGSNPGCSATSQNIKDDGQVKLGRTIKIGFLTSLTGVGAPGGKEMLEGINLYLDQSGYQLAGHKVELIVEDDESNPFVAVMKLKKMVHTRKIDILDGVLLSNVGYAISPFVEKCQIPAIFAVSGCDNLTKRQRYKCIVRTGVSASQSSQAFGEWVAKNLKYKRIVTLAVDFEYGYESVGGFQTTFEKSGGAIIQKIWVPLGVSDYTPWIRHIDRTADAIFLVGLHRSAVLLPEQIRKAGVDIPMIGCGSSFDEEVLPQLGDQALNSLSARVYTPALKRKENERFVSAYTKKYGHAPTYCSESSYTSALWLDKALRRIRRNSLGSQNLIAALKSVRLDDAPRGPIQMDEFGNPVENVYVSRAEKKNGQLQNKVIATIPAVSQFWSYQPPVFLKRPPYSRDYPPCSNCTGKSK